jgi:hypothetical protein
VEGYLTAENFIVGSTNLITEITSLETRLDTEEPKTTALQTLTSNHTTDIASNDTNITALQGRLDIEEPKTTALQTLTANHTTDIASLETRLDIEEQKTTALQILTSSHTTDIASNTAIILTKQDTITTSTDLDCNSITTHNLEVNTARFLNTIVLKRPIDITGEAGDFYLAL